MRLSSHKAKISPGPPIRSTGPPAVPSARAVTITSQMPLPEPTSASFKRHYSDQQKNAILDAHCRLGMSQRQITRHANAGTLPDPKRPGETLASFDISRGTVAIYIHRGAEDYRAFLLESPEHAMDAVDAGTAELLLQAGQGIRELKRRRKAGEDVDPKELQRLATLYATLRRAIRNPKTAIQPAGRKPNPEAGQKPQKPKTPEILKALGVDTGKRGIGKRMYEGLPPMDTGPE